MNISLGSINIPIKEVYQSLLHGSCSKESWNYIILNYRLPKAIVAILIGMGLSISGLLMQTLFRNPLAGPYVLGLSSGASLGVAVVLLGASLLPIAISPIFIVKSIGKLIVGDLSPKNLSGPITIAQIAGDSGKSGVDNFIRFVAMFSIMLGVMNLLPVPVLDGGHLMYYIIEVIKGSPVSDRIQIMGYKVGLALVMSLMVVATYNDIARTF